MTTQAAGTTGPAVARKPQFPFLDLKAQFSTIRDEVMAAVTRVMEAQYFILGPEVSSFEEEVKEQVGCAHAIGCASGSDAIVLALMALGVGPGDEVIAPPFTFVATAGSISRLGARPVFVDVDPQTYNLDTRQLEKLITPKTKAIIPVHLFGLSAEMDTILDIARRHKVAVIEDAAQAIGARYHGKPVGSMGTIGCFSFFPSKNLGGAGDGGLVTTNDPAIAERLKILRVHGSRRKYEYELLGMNSRLDSIQAAILRVKLKYLDRWAEGRRRNAQRYDRLIAEHNLNGKITPPVTPSNHLHVFNQYTIRTSRRDALKAYLQQQGIPTEIYYPHPLHLQPAFANLGYRPGSMPVSEQASEQVLSLPIFTELAAEQQVAVVAEIANFFDIQ